MEAVLHMKSVSLFFPLQFNLTFEESQNANPQSLRRLHTFLKYFLTHDKAGAEILTVSPQSSLSVPVKELN